MHPHVYVKTLELLVNTDLAVFEERRLQDLLTSRVGAPRFSVHVEDFHSRWNQRLSKLLDKRQLYQQVRSAPLMNPFRLIYKVNMEVQRTLLLQAVLKGLQASVSTTNQRCIRDYFSHMVRLSEVLKTATFIL